MPTSTPAGSTSGTTRRPSRWPGPPACTAAASTARRWSTTPTRSSTSSGATAPTDAAPPEIGLRHRAGAASVEAMTSFVSHTTVDCHDAYELSEWWKRLLGYVDVEDDPNEPGHDECMILDPDSG